MAAPPGARQELAVTIDAEDDELASVVSALQLEPV
jgi:hypothetical protein